MKQVPLRVDKVLSQKIGISQVLLKKAAKLTLVFEQRNKSRITSTLRDGRTVHLFLPRGNTMRHNDILIADNGELICVVAAEQEVVSIYSDDALSLMKASYHLGNRHIPVQVGANFLRIEPDSVLEEMLHQLGLECVCEKKEFSPEVGAYGGGHRHSHTETFDTDYALAQEVYHSHSPAQQHQHGHGHDHTHENLHSHDQ